MESARAGRQETTCSTQTQIALSHILFCLVPGIRALSAVDRELDRILFALPRFVAVSFNSACLGRGWTLIRMPSAEDDGPTWAI